MNALDVLMDEHRIIERVLDALETSTLHLEDGVTVPAAFFLSATEFMRGYADGRHHAKEEGILFPLMEGQGIPLDGCPLGVMLAEHECGRQYTRALDSAARALQAGEGSAKQRIIESSRSYIRLLREHIRREDNILFPMAGRVIPESQHGLLAEGFEHVEQEDIGLGKHERYINLANNLELVIKSYA